MVGDGFKQYRRVSVCELRPWSKGESMRDISVSGVDVHNGSPKEGDMIARNPKNHADKWLVAAEYFRENFEPMDKPLVFTQPVQIITNDVQVNTKKEEPQGVTFRSMSGEVKVVK